MTTEVTSTTKTFRHKGSAPPLAGRAPEPEAKPDGAGVTQPRRQQPKRRPHMTRAGTSSSAAWTIFVLALIGPALLLMALLTATASIRWVSMVHLADRLAATIACGSMLLAIVVKTAARAAPVNVAVNMREGARRHPIVVEPPPVVIDKYSRSLWNVALIAVVTWLLAAVSHLTVEALHPVAAAADDFTDATAVGRLFAAVAVDEELQFLVLQILLLVVLALCVVIEVGVLHVPGDGLDRSSQGAFKSRGYLAPRVYMGVLAFLALIPSAVAGLDQPISTRGILQVAHVAASVSWAGGLGGVLVTVRLAKREVGGGFLYLVAARYSEIALAMALLVFVSGVALALDGPKASLTGLFVPGPGLLVVTKAVLTAVLLGMGYWHRRVSLPRLLNPDLKDPTRTLYLLGLIELVIMAACIAAGVALDAFISSS